MSVTPSSDLQRDLGSSIAVKITAPVLWMLITVGVIFAVFMQGDVKNNLSSEVELAADHLAHELQSRLNDTQWQLAADDRMWLLEQLEITPIEAITLKVGDTIASVGGSDVIWEKIERDIIIIDGAGGGKNNIATLTLMHPPLNDLLKSFRREMLMKAGIPFLIFAITLAGLIHYSVTRPISELVEATQAVTKGDLSKRITSRRQDEFGYLGRFMNEMLDKLQEQQQQLSRSVIAAEAASTAKSSFLANMSHEIRTPLTAIVGFSEVLRDKELSEAQRESEVEAIIRSGLHLQEIINDILDFSKIEAGQLTIESIETSPIDILDEVASLFVARAEEKELEFNLKVEYPFPKKMVTDPTRMKQILINLCSNAVKFTDKGSVDMLARYVPEKNKLFVSVTDTGVGMGEKEQRYIFLPFTQADVSTTRQFGGTGLGLCISNELADRLGGEIRCHSEESVGTQFTLEINAGELAGRSLVDSREGLNRKPAEVKQMASQPDLKGRVLLAEDNPDNQRLLGFYLKRAGVEYIVAENGAEAVQFGAAEHFDLVLMDMQMPVMDGLTAIRILRQQKYDKPIVVLSANVLEEDRVACKEAGANDFLTKPVDVQRFNEMLDKYLVNKSV